MPNWLKEELLAFVAIFVGLFVLFVGGVIGDFFGGIGDKLFGSKKDGSNEPPSQSP